MRLPCAGRAICLTKQVGRAYMLSINYAVRLRPHAFSAPGLYPTYEVR